MAVEPKRMQQLRGTAVDWQNANPTLLEGELGLETDTNRFKVGPGAWNSLAYFYIPPALDNFTASAAPTVNDDISQGYSPGSRWFNAVSGIDLYTCASNTLGAAVWIQTAGAPVADEFEIGDIKLVSTTTWSSQFLEGTGQALPKASYPELDTRYSALGYPFGSDATNLFLPNLNGRSPIGRGASNVGGPNNVLGTTLGAHTVTLLQSNLPSVQVKTNATDGVAGGDNTPKTVTAPGTSALGSNVPFNVDGPRIALIGLVKVLP